MYCKLQLKSFFVCVCCVVAIDDHGGCRGDVVQVIAQWQSPVAPREALVVLYRVMCAALHRPIRMAIEMASKPRVFFSLSTRDKVVHLTL